MVNSTRKVTPGNRIQRRITVGTSQSFENKRLVVWRDTTMNCIWKRTRGWSTWRDTTMNCIWKRTRGWSRGGILLWTRGWSCGGILLWTVSERGQEVGHVEGYYYEQEVGHVEGYYYELYLKENKRLVTCGGILLWTVSEREQEVGHVEGYYYELYLKENKRLVMWRDSTMNCIWKRTRGWSRGYYYELYLKENKRLVMWRDTTMNCIWKRTRGWSRVESGYYYELYLKENKRLVVWRDTTMNCIWKRTRGWSRGGILLWTVSEREQEVGHVEGYYYELYLKENKSLVTWRDTTMNCIWKRTRGWSCGGILLWTVSEREQEVGHVEGYYHELYLKENKRLVMWRDTTMNCIWKRTRVWPRGGILPWTVSEREQEVGHVEGYYYELYLKENKRLVAWRDTTMNCIWKRTRGWSRGGIPLWTVSEREQEVGHVEGYHYELYLKENKRLVTWRDTTMNCIWKRTRGWSRGGIQLWTVSEREQEVGHVEGYYHELYLKENKRLVTWRDTIMNKRLVVWRDTTMNKRLVMWRDTTMNCIWKRTRVWSLGGILPWTESEREQEVGHVEGYYYELYLKENKRLVAWRDTTMNCIWKRTRGWSCGGILPWTVSEREQEVGHVEGYYHELYLKENKRLVTWRDTTMNCIWKRTRGRSCGGILPWTVSEREQEVGRVEGYYYELNLKENKRLVTWRDTTMNCIWKRTRGWSRGGILPWTVSEREQEFGHVEGYYYELYLKENKRLVVWRDTTMNCIWKRTRGWSRGGILPWTESEREQEVGHVEGYYHELYLKENKRLVTWRDTTMNCIWKRTRGWSRGGILLWTVSEREQEVGRVEGYYYELYLKENKRLVAWRDTTMNCIWKRTRGWSRGGILLWTVSEREQEVGHVEGYYYELYLKENKRLVAWRDTTMNCTWKRTRGWSRGGILLWTVSEREQEVGHVEGYYYELYLKENKRLVMWRDTTMNCIWKRTRGWSRGGILPWTVSEREQEVGRVEGYYHELYLKENKRLVAWKDTSMNCIWKRTRGWSRGGIPLWTVSEREQEVGRDAGYYHELYLKENKRLATWRDTTMNCIWKRTRGWSRGGILLWTVSEREQEVGRVEGYYYELYLKENKRLITWRVTTMNCIWKRTRGWSRGGILPWTVSEREQEFGHVEGYYYELYLKENKRLVAWRDTTMNCIWKRTRGWSRGGILLWTVSEREQEVGRVEGYYYELYLKENKRLVAWRDTTMNCIWKRTRVWSRGGILPWTVSEREQEIGHVEGYYYELYLKENKRLVAWRDTTMNCIWKRTRGWSRGGILLWTVSERKQEVGRGYYYELYLKENKRLVTWRDTTMNCIWKRTRGWSWCGILPWTVSEREQEIGRVEGYHYELYLEENKRLVMWRDTIMNCIWKRTRGWSCGGILLWTVSEREQEVGRVEGYYYELYLKENKRLVTWRDTTMNCIWKRTRGWSCGGLLLWTVSEREQEVGRVEGYYYELYLKENKRLVTWRDTTMNCIWKRTRGWSRGGILPWTVSEREQEVGRVEGYYYELYLKENKRLVTWRDTTMNCIWKRTRDWSCGGILLWTVSGREQEVGHVEGYYYELYLKENKRLVAWRDTTMNYIWKRTRGWSCGGLLLWTVSEREQEVGHVEGYYYELYLKENKRLVVWRDTTMNCIWKRTRGWSRGGILLWTVSEREQEVGRVEGYYYELYLKENKRLVMWRDTTMNCIWKRTRGWSRGGILLWTVSEREQEVGRVEGYYYELYLKENKRLVTWRDTTMNCIWKRTRGWSRGGILLWTVSEREQEVGHVEGYYYELYLKENKRLVTWRDTTMNCIWKRTRGWSRGGILLWTVSGREQEVGRVEGYYYELYLEENKRLVAWRDTTMNCIWKRTRGWSRGGILLWTVSEREQEVGRVEGYHYELYLKENKRLVAWRDTTMNCIWKRTRGWSRGGILLWTVSEREQEVGRVDGYYYELYLKENKRLVTWRDTTMNCIWKRTRGWSRGGILLWTVSEREQEVGHVEGYYHELYLKEDKRLVTWRDTTMNKRLVAWRDTTMNCIWKRQWYRQGGYLVIIQGL